MAKRKWGRSKRPKQEMISQHEIPIPCDGGEAVLMLKKFETYWKGYMYFTPDAGKRSTAGEIYFNFAKGPYGVLLGCIDKFLEEVEGPETSPKRNGNYSEVKTESQIAS